MTGLSGLSPGSGTAAALVIGGSAVFALGETSSNRPSLRSPTTCRQIICAGGTTR